MNHIKQLTDNNYQKYLKPTDNSYEGIRPLLSELPFPIDTQFEFAVVGHIQYFGWPKVHHWAKLSAAKREPQRYFMKILSRQRYG